MLANHEGVCDANRQMLEICEIIVECVVNDQMQQNYNSLWLITTAIFSKKKNTHTHTHALPQQESNYVCEKLNDVEQWESILSLKKPIQCLKLYKEFPAVYGTSEKKMGINIPALWVTSHSSKLEKLLPEDTWKLFDNLRSP